MVLQFQVTKPVNFSPVILTKSQKIDAMYRDGFYPDVTQLKVTVATLLKRSREQMTVQNFLLCRLFSTCR